MNCVVRLMKLRLALACCAALLIGTSSSANAAPMAIDFSLTSPFPMLSGTGTVVIDSSLLTPSVLTSDLNDLVSLSLMLTGILSVPSSTTFTKDDLDFWVLQTDSLGGIIDLNFFMRKVPVNIDGYAIDGVSPFHLELCDGPADANGSGCLNEDDRIDTLVIAVTNIGPVDGTVPEPTTLSLLGLGLAGIGARRWRQRKAT